MEDAGVTEIKELVSAELENDNIIEDKAERLSVVAEADHHKEISTTTDQEKAGGGIINHLISNFVSPLSPRSVRDVGSTEDGGSGGGGGGGGGIFNNWISGRILHQNEDEIKDRGNIEQVLQPAAAKEEHDQNDGGGGGGMFNNLISGIFHHESEGEKDEGNEQVQPAPTGSGGHGGSGGGLIIDNFASHLPASPLSDDDVGGPATEEASILIHSIVHD